jgi:murein DD-endopeptidase MepM/ murein hydrolase activator NlpD
MRMSRTRLVVTTFVGLITVGILAAPASAAPSIPQEPQVVNVHLGSAEVAKTSTTTAKRDSQVTVTAYPSAYGSLSNISQAFYGSPSYWPGLCSLNNITNCNLIQVGQTITVPTAAPQGSAPTPVTPAPEPTPATPQTSNNGWVDPLPGVCITSGWGPRWGSFHYGVDLGAGTGTPIHAAHSGTVDAAGWNWSGYGISVLLNNGGVWTHYAHMSRLNVSKGQYVNAGDVIGFVGATGNVTGPHLHFEVWTRGYWGSSNPQLNPIAYMADRGISLGC